MEGTFKRKSDVYMVAVDLPKHCQQQTDNSDINGEFNSETTETEDMTCVRRGKELYRLHFTNVCLILLCVGYCVYLGFALYTDPVGAILVTIIGALFFLYLVLRFTNTNIANLPKRNGIRKCCASVSVRSRIIIKR